MPARRIMQSCSQQGGHRVFEGRPRLTQHDLDLQVRIGGALDPPTPVRRIAVPNRKLDEKRTEGFQRRPPIPEAVVDLAAVQKPVLAPDETPFQAVAHSVSPEMRNRPHYCLCDWAAVCGGHNFRSREQLLSLLTHRCRWIADRAAGPRPV